MDKQKLVFIKECYEDNLNDAWHDSHTTCGEIYCEDAGGGVVTDEDLKYYIDDLATEYYEKNKKEVDEQYNFENGFCQEFRVARSNFIEAFAKVGK